MLACRQVENYTLLENPKKYYEQMVVSSVIFRLIFFFFLFSVIVPSYNLYARVTGTCSNCHTMHNSQGGASVEEFIAFENDGTANLTLLTTTCVGCHTGENTIDSTTPYVMGISEPVFGKNGNTLAGGNFWWVAQNDQNGHNIFPDNEDDYLKTAPGDIGFASCVTNACHANLHLPAAGFNGKNGCQSCHLYPKHHANDTTTKVVSKDQGWYRFLSGAHNTNQGVEGIEHKRWNFNATSNSHNEYLGKEQNGGYGFDGGLGNTTTAFCTGCHGKFHADQQSGGQWIRHPSDAVICDPDKPDSENSEYAVAFGGVYDPDVPVARISLGGVSSTVTPGSDMVMCLSCHVAHGSPYPDILRWDYDYMIAGGGGTGGCFKCHTDKN